MECISGRILNVLRRHEFKKPGDPLTTMGVTVELCQDLPHLRPPGSAVSRVYSTLVQLWELDFVTARVVPLGDGRALTAWVRREPHKETMSVLLLLLRQSKKASFVGLTATEIHHKSRYPFPNVDKLTDALERLFKCDILHKYRYTVEESRFMLHANFPPGCLYEIREPESKCTETKTKE